MNVNVLQSVNSFMGQFGLTISNPKQILAKVTTVAFAAILLADQLSVAGACKDPSGLNACVRNCALTDSACNQACFSNYC